MRHIIDPNSFTMPEFTIEALYLNDFIMRWKLKLQGVEDPAVYGVLDTKLLSAWQKHRAVLSASYFEYKRGHDVIPPLLAFVDALVLDWFAQLAGHKPFMLLDESRMLKLEDHWRKLNDIPGDKWEIKY